MKKPRAYDKSPDGAAIARTNCRAIDRLILGKLGNRFLSSWSFDLTWEYLMEQPYGDVY